MNVKIADNRKYRTMTEEEADDLFQQVAILELKSAKIKAAYEKKIADLKLSCESELETMAMELTYAAEELSAYILAHPERFVKPRQRKTKYGQYGLRSVSSISIQDPGSALADVKTKGIPAVVISEKLDKKALERAIADGYTIAGVVVEKGEIASYKVTRVLEEA